MIFLIAFVSCLMKCSWVTFISGLILVITDNSTIFLIFLMIYKNDDHQNASSPSPLVQNLCVTRSFFNKGLLQLCFKRQFIALTSKRLI